MDLSISELVRRGRLAAETCGWELRLDGCLTRPPTPADLTAISDPRPRTDEDARKLLEGLFAGPPPAGSVAWGADEATAVLSAYVAYLGEWQAKKQAASVSAVAEAVRERSSRTSPRNSGARPG